MDCVALPLPARGCVCAGAAPERHPCLEDSCLSNGNSILWSGKSRGVANGPSGTLLQGSQAMLQWLGDHMVPPSRALLQRHSSKLSHRDECHSVLMVGKAETLSRKRTVLTGDPTLGVLPGCAGSRPRPPRSGPLQWEGVSQPQQTWLVCTSQSHGSQHRQPSPPSCSLR